MADLNDGLVAYYPFDGNAKDMSGNGNDGKIDGKSAYVEGHSGQAFYFDGNTVIDANDPFLNNISDSNSMTVSLWVKTTTTKDSAGLVNQWTACTNEGGDDNWHFTLYGNINALHANALHAEIPSYDELSMDSNLIIDGNFHQIAFVYTGTKMIIFVDGQSKTSQYYDPGSSFKNGTPLSIGGFLYCQCPYDHFFCWSYRRSPCLQPCFI